MRPSTIKAIKNISRNMKPKVGSYSFKSATMYNHKPKHKNQQFN